MKLATGVAFLVVFGLLARVQGSSGMGCMDEDGNPVDWWAALKYPDGSSYSYADSQSPVFRKSREEMADETSGALSHTLNQIYKGSQSSTGYILYNDESPDGKKWGTSWGHFKGAVGMTTSGGFWLVHSTPRMPETVANGWSGFPAFANKYGQEFLCVSLSTDGLNTVGVQMQLARPHIFDSNAPSFVSSLMPDLQDAIGGKHVTTASSSIKEITTRGGETFISFMKTGKWGKDLYEDLVAPTLKAGLFTETWQNGVGNLPSYCNSSYPYNAINVNHVKMPEGTEWKNSQDHSKWCVTMDRNVHIACFGGINRQHGNTIRGGGTLCWKDNKEIWESVLGIVEDTKPCAR
jgi:deoxyribonuclease II